MYSLNGPRPRAALQALGAVIFGGLAMGAGCPNNTFDVEMRDGALLATDVYRASAPAPTIVMRTPYGRGGIKSTGEAFATLGYSAVAQDIRGMGDSDGTFMLFADDGWGANQDGFDTVEWASGGDWSDGRSCIYGGSALAIAGLAAAGAAPPSLECMFSLVGTGDLFHQAAYQGGALRESLLVGWLTGIGALEALDVALASQLETDPIWQPTTLSNVYEDVNIPIYHYGGWYDIFTQGTIDAFVDLNALGGDGARGAQKMLIGPWTHGSTSGELTYPDSALPGGEEVRFFEHYLKGVDNGIGTEPPVRYYLMGDPDRGVGAGNRWVTASSWPPPATLTPWYLRSGASLSAAPPGAQEGAERFTFDPADPVPTVGGNNLILPAGPFDQRSVLSRADVRVWQTGVLGEPVTVAGPIGARLFVSSSAVDADFTVKLLDIYPDGRAMLVMDGITRMRFRDGQDHEALMVPGQVYEAEVDLWSTALVFETGHRIAVAVSSSNYPRFDVNPGTGAPAHEGGPMVVAEQQIFQDAAHPSRLMLPVVSGSL